MNSIIILFLRNDSDVCTYIIIIHTEVRGLKRLTWGSSGSRPISRYIS